jgi:hypothetical protein
MPGQNVPGPDLLDAVVSTLARFHASWWEHPLLCSDEGDIGCWFPTRAAFEAMVAETSSAYG